MMSIEDRPEVSKLFSLKRPARCARFPCQSLRAAEDSLYCTPCREAITAEAWLLIEVEEPTK